MTEIVPVIQEVLTVDKRLIETGARVRVSKSVDEVTETVRQSLLSDRYEVERLPMNVPVDEAPGVRHEGDCIVVSVVEERLVTRKQLVVVEEIRLTRRTTSTDTEHSFRLAREVAIVERLESPDDVWKEV